MCKNGGTFAASEIERGGRRGRRREKIFSRVERVSLSLAPKGDHDGLSSSAARSLARSLFPRKHHQSNAREALAFSYPRLSRNALASASRTLASTPRHPERRKKPPRAHVQRAALLLQQHHRRSFAFRLVFFSRTCNFRLLLLLLLPSARTSALSSPRAAAAVTVAGRLSPSSGRAALPTPRRRISLEEESGDRSERGEKKKESSFVECLSRLWGPFLPASTCDPLAFRCRGLAVSVPRGGKGKCAF